MKDYVIKHDCSDPRFLVCINLGSFRIFLFYHTMLGALYGYLTYYLRYKRNRKASFLLEEYKDEQPENKGEEK